MTGHFIVIEGLEGAGKTTAINTVTQWIKTHSNKEIVTIREPGGTRIAEVIRRLVKGEFGDEPIAKETELLLLYAARKQLVEQVIMPTLAKGHWLVADRFELSSFAYQGAGRGINTKIIETLSAFCLKDLRPDLTLFLDITPALGLERVGRRGAKDRIEQEPLAFFESIRACYLELIRGCQSAQIIDASLGLEEVQQHIVDKLNEHFS